MTLGNVGPAFAANYAPRLGIGNAVISCEAISGNTVGMLRSDGGYIIPGKSRVRDAFPSSWPALRDAVSPGFRISSEEQMIPLNEART